MDRTPKLHDLAQAYRDATQALDDARAALITGVRDASAQGMRQADIIRDTGHVWTREQVRRVLAD